MKKNAFIGPLPPPIGGVAVINQSFQNIVYEDFEVISFDTSDKREREDLYSTVKLKSILRNLQISKKLKKFIEEEQPDVINIFITSGMSILRDILFLKKMSKYNIPIIIHFHSKTKGEFALKPKRLRLVSKYFNRFGSRIILLSEQHYSFFVKYFGEEKCEIIENFVRYSDFNNVIQNKNEDFLFVGRLSKEKGFFDLLEAANILKQRKIYCRIQVIGVAETEELEIKIKEFVKNNELKNYFVFHGTTFGKAKYALFKQSRCLIFPSHFENSPVVLKEAIAAKMAILTSDIEANINILQNRENYLLFEKGNGGDLAIKMIELCTSTEKTSTMCKVSENIMDYDVSVAQRKLLNLFNQLVSKHEE